MRGERIQVGEGEAVIDRFDDVGMPESLVIAGQVDVIQRIEQLRGAAQGDPVVQRHAENRLTVALTSTSGRRA
jgi:hypothetical protein